MLFISTLCSVYCIIVHLITVYCKNIFVSSGDSDSASRPADAALASTSSSATASEPVGDVANVSGELHAEIESPASTAASASTGLYSLYAELGLPSAGAGGHEAHTGEEDDDDDEAAGCATPPELCEGATDSEPEEEKEIGAHSIESPIAPVPHELPFSVDDSASAPAVPTKQPRIRYRRGLPIASPADDEESDEDEVLEHADEEDDEQAADIDAAQLREPDD